MLLTSRSLVALFQLVTMLALTISKHKSLLGSPSKASFLLQPSALLGWLVSWVTSFLPPFTLWKLLVELFDSASLPSSARREEGCFIPDEGTPMPTPFRLSSLSFPAEPSANELSASVVADTGRLLFLDFHLSSLVCRQDCNFENDRYI